MYRVFGESKPGSARGLRCRRRPGPTSALPSARGRPQTHGRLAYFHLASPIILTIYFANVEEHIIFDITNMFVNTERGRARRQVAGAVMFPSISCVRHNAAQ